VLKPPARGSRTVVPHLVGHQEGSSPERENPMATVKTTDNEARDAEKVEEALKALVAGDVKSAEPLLLAVIANTPADYSHISEDDNGWLVIRFWDEHEFIHYVTWQRQEGIERGVRWIWNAYPRAHFYMGFLCVKTRQFERALEYLSRGQQLEPTNPKFNFEMAQALVHSGQREKALALYEAVKELGPHVSARDLAIAHRGRGFVLIEMKRLDEAEEALKSSLEFEPGNEIAMNELRYIEHLRRGGHATVAEAVPSQAPSLSLCAVCGKEFTEGVVINVKGMPRSVCKTCKEELRKK
jgi:tetratricopeptide (TPR) repeat protein